MVMLMVVAAAAVEVVGGVCRFRGALHGPRRLHLWAFGKEDYLGCSDIAQGFGGSRSA